MNLPIPKIFTWATAALLTSSSFATLAAAQEGSPGHFGGRAYQYGEIFGSGGNHLGQSAPAGDINGDGYEDYFINLWARWAFQNIGKGVVRIHSGLDGSVLRTHNGAALFDRLGYQVGSIGDLNSDGVPEYLAAAPTSDTYGVNFGFITLFDGASGTSIRDIPGKIRYGYFGSAMVTGFDFDGDGVGDFAAMDDCDPSNYSGDPRQPKNIEPNGRKLRVYSGADYDKLVWSPMYVVDFPSSASRALRGLSDINGDGRDEITAEWGSARRILSGSDGSVIWTAPFTTNSNDGMVSIGDINADGVPEFALGRQSENANSGRIRVYSGATQSEIYSVNGQSGWSLGAAMEAMNDVNGDGYGDFAAAAPADFRVQIISGIDGAVLGDIVDDWNRDAAFAIWMSSADVNNDGRRELLIGAPDQHTATDDWAGALYLAGFEPMMTASDNTISAALGGSIDFEMDFPDGITKYKLLASLAGPGATLYGDIQVPLIFDSLTWSTLSSPPSSFMNSIGTTDANGEAMASVVVAPGELTSLTGMTVRFSALSLGGAFGPGTHFASCVQTVLVVL